MMVPRDQHDNVSGAPFRPCAAQRATVPECLYRKRSYLSYSSGNKLQVELHNQIKAKVWFPHKCLRISSHAHN